MWIWSEIRFCVNRGTITHVFDLPTLLPTMKAVADLKPEIKKLFLKQIIDLFGTYEEFWISNTTNGFKLQHNIDDTLTIIRLRECINCGVEQFSDPILTKKDVDKELTKPITVLCSTCEHFVLPMFIYDA